MRRPCQTIRIVANARKRACPNRRNSGSYVVSRLVMACCTVATRARREDCGMMRASGLTPAPEIVRRARYQDAIGGRAQGQATALHIHDRGLRVALAFAVD